MATRWFRHRETGDKGFLVEVDGKQMIQYDRGPHVKQQVDYRESQWEEQVDIRVLTPAQLGRLAYECDRALCDIARLVQRTPKAWMDLRDGEREAWTKNGPPRGHRERRMLFEAVMTFGKVFAG